MRWDRLLAALVLLGTVAALFLLAATRTSAETAAWLAPTVLSCIAAMAFLGFLGEAEREKSLPSVLKTIAAAAAFISVAIGAGLGHGPASAQPAPLDGWLVPISVLVTVVIVGSAFVKSP